MSCLTELGSLCRFGVDARPTWFSSPFVGRRPILTDLEVCPTGISPKRLSTQGMAYNTGMTYSQSTGRFCDAEGNLLTVGYSGHDAGVNNPAMQNQHNVGPLPQGVYAIGDPLDPPDHLGPLAMPLTPDPANEMFDRSEFFIHGDNQEMNRSASNGCIILDHTARAAIAAGSDRMLTVTG